MPANKKYLNPSVHQRFAKITAGFVGGYCITSTLFLVLAFFIDHGPVLFTLKFGGFIVWCGLMIVPFLFKNGWKAWGIYLLVTGLFSAILYFVANKVPEFLLV